MVQTEILMEAITDLSEKMDWKDLQRMILRRGIESGFDPDIKPQWDKLYEYIDQMYEPDKDRLLSDVQKILYKRELTPDVFEEAWIVYSKEAAMLTDHVAKVIADRYDLSDESVRELAEMLLDRLKQQFPF